MDNDRHETPSLTYEETTFFGLFKISGWKSFKNWSIAYALILTIIFFAIIMIINVPSIKTSEIIYVAKELSPLLLSAATGVFGIVIAALTITISLFSEALLPKMLNTKLLHKYLFPFWKAVVLWAINIILSIFLTTFTLLKFNKFFLIESLLFLELFIFFYAVFYTIKLTGLVVQLALQKAQIIEK
ncbi:hypothetical protein JF536_11340 [Priestia flexa]|uniref:hypothetical protein n=1 Tax=Priestia flexa TaxID=86664 RepID=UPI001A8C249D|nr:hypothetical protein [Priestia flexa]MBN8434689.1 hypothetical protein [Priestia flexa]MCA0967228.1 hypothetical protein [Priestia flexa]